MQIQEYSVRYTQKLSEFKYWLLSMLMNGQVTVSEAEQELGMVTEDRGTYK